MSNKEFVPFGGIHGWLADLTVPAKQRSRAASAIQSYYVAEPDERRALESASQRSESDNDQARTSQTHRPSIEPHHAV